VRKDVVRLRHIHLLLLMLRCRLKSGGPIQMNLGGAGVSDLRTLTELARIATSSIMIHTNVSLRLPL
jgi:hypothetical protein